MIQQKRAKESTTPKSDENEDDEAEEDEKEEDEDHFDGEDAVDNELSDVEDGKPTKSKKGRRANDDAALAAKLHSELNKRSLRTSAKRKTGASRKKPIKEKRELTEAQKNNPFQKPMLLSQQLSALLGEPELSRPQTVKKLWNYIKEHNLQNPENKREVLCDENMKPIFGQKTDIFAMNSILTSHLYKKDEVL